MRAAPLDPPVAKDRYPSKAKIARMLRAATECGLKVHSVEVTPSGTIKVVGGASEPLPADEFSKWEAAGRL